MTTHTPLPVKQLGTHTFMAPCSCGEYWDGASCKEADRQRLKHIRNENKKMRQATGGAS